jgi:hypothetical protein
MYADTKSSRELGKLSGRLLDLVTELGSRREDDDEDVFVRPSDYAKYEALLRFVESKWVS